MDPSPAPAVAPYWQVARRTFQRYATYRGATLAGVFTNTVFGFLKVYVLLAVFRSRSHIGSFDAVDVVTFSFLSQGFLATVSAFGGLDLSDRIRTGDVVTDLYRPVNFQGYWLAQDLGRAAYQALARGVPPFLIGALFFRLRLPPDLLSWVGFVVGLALAVVVSFGYRFVVGLAGFWLLDNRGLAQVAVLVMQFFAGAVLPLTFFPGALGRAARMLPFASVIQLPIEIFLGKHRGLGATADVLGTQALWAVVLVAAGQLVAARAFRKVVIQGG